MLAGLRSDRERSVAFSEWCQQQLKNIGNNKSDPSQSLQGDQASSAFKLKFLSFIKKSLKRENLFWPEFRRKYRRDDRYQEFEAEDAEKEELYRALQNGKLIVVVCYSASLPVCQS